MNIDKKIEHLKSINFNLGEISLNERLRLLNNLKISILKFQPHLLNALRLDLGKSEFESYATEIGFILEDIRFILKNLKKWSKPKKVCTPLPLWTGKSIIYPEPYGIVLIISPWNYPFQLCFSPLIGAIAAGNRVILKVSEYTPNTNQIINLILNDVFSRDEILFFDGGPEETQEILKSELDYIFFTGSTQVGKIVMEMAAKNLTPVTLELGGKSPCIIEESANLDLAAKKIVWGKFLNAGQTCVAPDYVLVPSKLQGHLIEKIKKWLEIFYADVLHSPDYSRIINDKHFHRLIKLINRDKVVIGGGYYEKNRLIEPTVMRDISWDDVIMEEEIFGPILPIIPYESLNTALDKVRNRHKPLALYFFSSNNKYQEEVIKKISFGGGCINDTIIHLANPHLPFGGVGKSGIGHYHGKKTFDTFSHLKSIFHQSSRFDFPVRYPPYKNKLKILKLFIR